MISNNKSIYLLSINLLSIKKRATNCTVHNLIWWAVRLLSSRSCSIFPANQSKHTSSTKQQSTLQLPTPFQHIFNYSNEFSSPKSTMLVLPSFNSLIFGHLMFFYCTTLLVISNLLYLLIMLLEICTTTICSYALIYCFQFNFTGLSVCSNFKVFG